MADLSVKTETGNKQRQRGKLIRILNIEFPSLKFLGKYLTNN